MVGLERLSFSEPVSSAERVEAHATRRRERQTASVVRMMSAKTRTGPAYCRPRPMVESVVDYCTYLSISLAVAASLPDGSSSRYLFRFSFAPAFLPART